MITRIESLKLISTDRVIAFEPGLNVIAGPISTGKSSLIRLCRVLLGSPVEDLTPEIRHHVTAVGGTLALGAGDFLIVRPLVTTDTAMVEVAGEGTGLRLPAMRALTSAPTTYGRWLLQQLELPILEVPSAPTRPSESSMSPVSINDYMRYCKLEQDEIDSSVFGHSNPFKDIKRKYVFQIVYGLYSSEIAALQDRLRTLEARRRALESGGEAFMSFLEGTVWENRAVLEERLARVEADLAVVQTATAEAASTAPLEPQGQTLRRDIASADVRISECRTQIEFEERSINQLEELGSQLGTQSVRLTKSIVAGSKLLDIDFQLCPRCGAGVDQHRATDDSSCYLCLQPPQTIASKTDLIIEQDRVEAQLLETEQLVASRKEQIEELRNQLSEAEEGRVTLASGLDRHAAGFVADSVDEISERASRESTLTVEAERLHDYIDLYRKLDEAQNEVEALVAERDAVVAELEQLGAADPQIEQRISQLEQRFAEYIDAFGTPVFEGDPRAAINRDNFMPIVNGRTFGQLSSGGLRTLTNLAYALAHHRAAIDLGLKLPGILLIDGIQKNVGRDDYDAERVNKVFETLVALSEEIGYKLQIIVTANDVPQIAESFVRVHLSEEDRLVPIV